MSSAGGPETNSVFPFIVGCGRSGTTLVRAILNHHSLVAIPPEAQFVPMVIQDRAQFETSTGFDLDAFVTRIVRHERFEYWQLCEAEVREALDRSQATTVEAGLRAVYALYAHRHGKRCYGDKTPVNVLYISSLAGAFPDSRFLHIIRDGRDVALSFLDQGWAETAPEAALHWKLRVERGARTGRALGPSRYRELRYEDLVQNPEQSVRDVCAFFDMTFEDQMLRYFDGAAELIRNTPNPDRHRLLTKPVAAGLRDWREQMPEDDCRTVDALVGRTLREFGYEVARSPSLPSRAQAARTVVHWQLHRASQRLGAQRRRVRAPATPQAGGPPIALVLHVLPRVLARGAQTFASSLRVSLDGDELDHRTVVLFEGGEGSLRPDYSLGVPTRGPRVLGFDPRAALRLRSLVSVYRPAVVIAHGGEPLKYAALAKLGRGPKLIYYSIGSIDTAIRGRARRAFYRTLARRADAVAAVSEFSARNVRAALGIDAIAVIPNGRDGVLFRPPANGAQGTRIRLGWVGYLEEPKRPELFLWVVEQLRARGMPVEGIVVGDGPLLDTLRERAEQCAVKLLGRRDDVPELLRTCDALIFTSASEGMPGVLIEAGLTGLPVVSTDVGAVRSVVVPGKTGLVVPPDDDGALLAAACTVVADTELRRAMGESARRRCLQHFSSESSYAAWSQLITRVMNPPTVPEPAGETGRKGSRLDRTLAITPLVRSGRALHAHRLVVLAYHQVDDPATFATHLDELADHYRAVTLAETLALGEGTLAARNSVLISFDDATRNVLDVAAPLLRERDLPAVAFVVAGTLGTTSPFWWTEVEARMAAGAHLSAMPTASAAQVVKHLKLVPNDIRLAALEELRASTPDLGLSTDQLRRCDLPALVAQGIEVGSHSLTHPCLNRCDDTTIEREVHDAHAILTDALGAPPLAFAYPNGDHDARVRGAVRAAGYRAAFLFDHRMQATPWDDPLLVSRVRINSTSSIDRFRLIVSGVHPVLHSLRGRS